MDSGSSVLVGGIVRPTRKEKKEKNHKKARTCQQGSGCSALVPCIEKTEQKQKKKERQQNNKKKFKRKKKIEKK